MADRGVHLDEEVAGRPVGERQVGFVFQHYAPVELERERNGVGERVEVVLARDIFAPALLHGEPVYLISRRVRVFGHHRTLLLAAAAGVTVGVFR